MLFTWGELGLPLPQASGFGHVVDLAFVSTPFSTEVPRRKRKNTAGVKSYTLEFYLTRSQLATAEEILTSRGYSGFALRLGGPGCTELPVGLRLTDRYTVSALGNSYFKLSLQAETAESCEMYVAILDGITFPTWPDFDITPLSEIASSWWYAPTSLSMELDSPLGLTSVVIEDLCDLYWDYVIFQANFEEGFDDESQAFREMDTTLLYILRSRTGNPTLYGLDTSKFISTPVTTSSGLALGTGDFTAEAYFWVPSEGLSAGFLFLVQAPNAAIYSDGSGGVYGYLNTSTYKTGTISISAGAWHHIALVRSSGVLELYVDGTASGSPRTYSYDLTSGRYFFYPNTGGNISSLRVKKGEALYTSDFTSPTDEFTVSNDPSYANTTMLVNFIDGAVDLSQQESVLVKSALLRSPKVGLSFVYGSGVTSNLTAYTYPFNFETTNFTVEFWMYQDSTGNSQQIKLFYLDGEAYGILRHTDGTTFGYSSVTTAKTGSFTVPLDSWHHYALERNGTSLELYVDGQASGAPYTLSGVSQVESRLYFFTTDGGSLSGIRTTLGVARYKEDFIPQVRLLTLQCSGGTG